MKRKPEYELDRKTFDPNNANLPPPNLEKKDDENKEPPKSGLFSSLFNGSNNGGNSLFGNKNSLMAKQSELDKDKLESNVTNYIKSSNLFANLLEQKKKEEEAAELAKQKAKEKEEEREAQDQKTKIPKKKTSLFANFANPNPAPSQGLSLFAKLGSQPVTFSSLISNKDDGTAPKTFLNKDDDNDNDGEEEGEGEGDDIPRSASPEIDYSKVEKNVQYDDPFEKIISKDVEKFRCSNNPVLGKGTISLNKAKDADAYFIVYRNLAKLILYQGQLVKNISKVSNFNGKQDVLQIKTLTTKDDKKEKSENQEGKYSKYNIDILKLMFITYDDSTNFKNEVEKILVQKKNKPSRSKSFKLNHGLQFNKLYREYILQK